MQTVSLRGIAAAWWLPYHSRVARRGGFNLGSPGLVNQPGCFAAAIAEAGPIPVRWDHNLQIGQIGSLEESEAGLAFRLELELTPLGRVARDAARWGQLGASVGARDLELVSLAKMDPAHELPEGPTAGELARKGARWLVTRVGQIR
jgi:hypothetical protein